MNIDKLLKDKGGIRLDIGCGEHPQPGFVGIDKRDVEGVDIVHDLEVFPWPLPNESCLIVMASHIVEHIKPWLFFDFMNEIWRVMKPRGDFAAVHPYGVNDLFVQDPTHCNPMNAASWQYFDPCYPLWQIYKPKPWFIKRGLPVWQVTGLMEVAMYKLAEEDAEELATLGVDAKKMDKYNG